MGQIKSIMDETSLAQVANVWNIETFEKGV